jgi:hypothetical protein
MQIVQYTQHALDESLVTIWWCYFARINMPCTIVPLNFDSCRLLYVAIELLSEALSQ